VDKDDQKKDSAYRPGNARLLRRVAVVAALAATGLLATACGGGGSQSSGQNLAAELDSFASCVRSHGIPGFYFTTSVPSAPPDGGVIGDHQYYAAYDSTPAFEAAQKACQRLDPMGTPSATRTGRIRVRTSAVLGSRSASIQARRSSRPRRRPVACHPTCDRFVGRANRGPRRQARQPQQQQASQPDLAQ
jgi:hypothetical protein